MSSHHESHHGSNAVADTPAAAELTGSEVAYGFDDQQPVLRSISMGAAQWHNSYAQPPRVQLEHVGYETLWTDELTPEIVQRSRRVDAVARDTLVYRVELTWDQQPAVDFSITCTLADQDQLVMELTAVHEHEGFRLLAMRLPAVLAVDEDQPGAKMLVPFKGGRLVDPATADPGRREQWPGFDYHWFGGAVRDDQLMAMVTVPSVDDTLYHIVDRGESRAATRQLSGVDAQIVGWEFGPDDSTPEARRFAGIEVHWQYRAPSPCSNLRFIVEHRPHCLIDLVPRTKPHAEDWLDAARLVRDRIEARPCPTYDGLLLTRFNVQRKDRGFQVSFDQVLEWIRTIHHLTDGAPQIAYLVGFQHEGHDTGFPHIFTSNEAAGGMDRLQKLFREAAELNVQISFHDNVQASYKASPDWNIQLPARDEKGELRKGAVWSGGQVYLMGQARYARQIEHRLDRTLKTYPMLDKSIYWDAMTTYLGRHDFTPGDSHGLESELDGKKRMIQAARQRGLEVVSETFCPYLLDHLSHTLRLHHEPQPLFGDGERRVPFTCAAFHGRTTWGGNETPPKPAPGESEADARRRGFMSLLISGSGFTAAISPLKPLNYAVQGLYLVELPRQLLRHHVVTDYACNDSVERLTFKLEDGEGQPRGDTFIEVDHQRLSYHIVVNGDLIARDFTTLTPSLGDASHWLSYNFDGGPQQFPLPARWHESAPVRAHVLQEDGSVEQLDCTVHDGQICWTAPACKPVRFTVQLQENA